MKNGNVERLLLDDLGLDAEHPRWFRAGVIRRFWSHVRKTDGCWLWEGATCRGGYGQFKVESRACVQAHRYAWLVECGPLRKGHVVSAACGEPRCVRPGHLYLRRYSPKAARREDMCPA